MSVPKKRSATRRRKLRASHHALKKTKTTTCPKCEKPCLPHTACKNCGYYKGRDVLGLEAKMDKKAKKSLQKKQEKEKLEKTDKEMAQK